MAYQQSNHKGRHTMTSTAQALQFAHHAAAQGQNFLVIARSDPNKDEPIPVQDVCDNYTSCERSCMQSCAYKTYMDPRGVIKKAKTPEEVEREKHGCSFFFICEGSCVGSCEPEKCSPIGIGGNVYPCVRKDTGAPAL
jgi:hypothetical protein